MSEFRSGSESRSITRRVIDALETWRLPVFGWIQVEVSSCCPGECVYCPHTVFKDRWQQKLMSLETYRKLLPAFRKTRLVYLQGWGEPFTNPDLFDMMHLAKNAGCRVGTSTNGMLLDSEKIDSLVESDLDIITFSLAGTGNKNGYFRKGTCLEKVLAGIKRLNDAKLRYGATKPAIHIAYLLLRSARDELTMLPELLKDLSVSQVVISTLDFVPNDELAEEVIPRDAAEYDRTSRLLSFVSERARKYNIGVHYSLVKPNERRPVCTENVLYSIFVSSDGSVSPCVFRNLPIRSDSLANESDERIYKRLEFGNVNHESLARIWNKVAYKSFRKSFPDDCLDGICLNCPKLHIAEA
jgi:MoaA/NifB/PqqE/SkfB family radical SAM enzyme